MISCANFSFRLDEYSHHATTVYRVSCVGNTQLIVSGHVLAVKNLSDVDYTYMKYLNTNTADAAKMRKTTGVRREFYVEIPIQNNNFFITKCIKEHVFVGTFSEFHTVKRDVFLTFRTLEGRWKSEHSIAKSSSASDCIFNQM